MGHSVWERGENRYPGFACKYCKEKNKGGGPTRFKQHLGGRESNVVHCNYVPTDICDYYRPELVLSWIGLTRGRKKCNQRACGRDEIAAKGNANDDDEEEL